MKLTTPLLTLLTLVCVVGISAGQILFKQAASILPENAEWQHWIFNGWLIAALIIYGATTLLWIAILRYAPLHWAYPFMGLAFIIVPTLAWAIFGEPLTAQTLVGGFFILAGIVIAASQSNV